MFILPVSMFVFCLFRYKVVCLQLWQSSIGFVSVLCYRPFEIGRGSCCQIRRYSYSSFTFFSFILSILSPYRHCCCCWFLFLLWVFNSQCFRIAFVTKSRRIRFALSIYAVYCMAIFDTVALRNHACAYLWFSFASNVYTYISCESFSHSIRFEAFLLLLSSCFHASVYLYVSAVAFGGVVFGTKLVLLQRSFLVLFSFSFFVFGLIRRFILLLRFFFFIRFSSQMPGTLYPI